MYRSLDKGGRAYDASSDSDSASDSGDSSGSDDGRGKPGGGSRPTRAAMPMCTHNQLMLSILGIIVIVAIAGVLLYNHFSPDGLSSLFSSSSSSSSPSSTAAAATSTKTATASAAASSSASKGGSDSSATSSPSATGDSSKGDSSSTATATATASGDSPSSTSSSSSGKSGGDGAGLFGVSDDTCGDSGAVEEPVAGGGPNGSQEWLNCGISKDKPDGKWTPPHIEVTQLKSVALDEALKLDVFSACGEFQDSFQSAGDEYGIPPILIVAIAMTESSCNPDAKGDNGDAWGLMQILSDKVLPPPLHCSPFRVLTFPFSSTQCDGAPSGNCADPDFNIKRGTEYFKSQLEEFDGSTLLALGQYNGWYDGLTYNGATKMAADQSTCVYQNNLDYFQVTLNGYMQGVDGQQLATIKNLAVCDDPR
ncbi:hypothetical protein JCM6882_006668 [Rhodosporidiobolus microsporus]